MPYWEVVVNGVCGVSSSFGQLLPNPGCKRASAVLQPARPPSGFLFSPFFMHICSFGQL